MGCLTGFICTNVTLLNITQLIIHLVIVDKIVIMVLKLNILWHSY